jgi:simple sugar transport system permease protein
MNGKTLLLQTLASAVPYAFAALGGTICERSGVANIALEGAMLVGAFAAAAGGLASGSLFVALVSAFVAGGAFLAIHGFAVVRLGVSSIVSGVAMNLIAAGGTRFLLRAIYGSSANSPTVEAFSASGAGRLILPALAVVALVATLFFFRKTALGHWLVAAGEAPEALVATGHSVAPIRFWAVVVSGALAALGGAALAVDLRQFQGGMTAGRGFIALAAVILSGWRPGRAALACLGFALLDAVQVGLQAEQSGHAELLSAFPYVATLLLLIALGKRAGERTPRALS